MELKNSFVHHVYFWLKNPDSQEDLQQLIAGLEALSVVKELQYFHIGLPAATDRAVVDRTYAVSWLNVFATSADHDVYQTHPLHLKFIADCKHLWGKVIVYDSVQY